MNNKIIKIITIAAAALTLSGCYFFPAEEELLEPPTVAIEDVAYSTYTAKIKDIASQTMASGYVTAKEDFNCGFTESGGILKKIHVNVGDFVEEGQLIAELDTGNLEYLYEQQKLIVEKARITYVNSGSSTEPKVSFSTAVYSLSLSASAIFSFNSQPSVPLMQWETGSFFPSLEAI